MGNYVYELNNVSLTFKETRKISLLYKMGGSSGPVLKKRGTFKALDGITLNIERGKTIGIIGRNGCGKTTLLRILARIYGPDAGTIKIHSNSVSLLALGVGFDPNATGFENIYLSALLSGYSKKQVDEKVEEIIRFADIGDFIYGPIKTYSSGMKIRLAFSIAVHFQPDVLLIDEALSVGDAEFQKKSAAKMHELIMDNNRTVIIVSHSMSFLKTVCDEIIWLDKGKIRMIGNPDEVIAAYVNDIDKKK